MRNRFELVDDKALAVDGDVVNGPPAVCSEGSSSPVSRILQCENMFDADVYREGTQCQVQTVNAARGDDDRIRGGVQPASTAEQVGNAHPQVE